MSETNLERLVGIVDRITYHNEQNGWSVLKVSPFKTPGKLVAVLLHQEKAFAGATMEFRGTWVHHPKFGEQFKAQQAIEKRPATTAALEKYLGSGLIRGVGPATARKIVRHFKDETLDIFENRMDELLHVPGIASRKLQTIRSSWEEHKAIRDVMIFLQGHGISTLFAVKIFKAYQKDSIEIVSTNPYRLAHDIHGIGFFSADKIALNMGFSETGKMRIEAGIKHVLQAGREQGHCFLYEEQIFKELAKLLQLERPSGMEKAVLEELVKLNEIKLRELNGRTCYYSNSLYFDEIKVAGKIKGMIQRAPNYDTRRASSWVERYCNSQKLLLSSEQQEAVCGIAGKSFAILTGGPGCGKTTTTKVLVALLKAMGKSILLAAPTGRAAQRMTEVIGKEALTIHRLLEWNPSQSSFQRDEKNPLKTDFLIVDECSMLDISLASRLLQAVPLNAQVLFIGDPDQLPAVGAGNVLRDLIDANSISTFKLTRIFRQAEQSSIIRFAHQINQGILPKIISPVHQRNAFLEGHDCLFVDCDEATREQITFLSRVKHFLGTRASDEETDIEKLFIPTDEAPEDLNSDVLRIPRKFSHVNFQSLSHAQTYAQELKEIIKNIHPWSTLHYGLDAQETLLRFYSKTIKTWLGGHPEIQILSPQVRGTLGTQNLNNRLQAVSNPPAETKRELKLGDRIFREGDRVIQTRNNYDLGVFNGDIGNIVSIDIRDMTMQVRFQGNGQKDITFSREDVTDLSLAYAITIHKSQGSEFEVVIIPVLGQHFNMLCRNLIYTGLTRAKRLTVFVGSRKALDMAIKRQDQSMRQTALKELLS